MKTINDALVASRETDANKHDFTTQLRHLEFIERQLTYTNGARTAYDIEDWALTQMIEKLNTSVDGQKLGLSRQYLSRCPANLFDANLNHWLYVNEFNRWFVRTAGDKVRGVLSDRFAPIDNSKILEATSKIIGDTPHKLIRPVVGRDELHLRLLFIDKAGPKGNYGTGVYISNGEIGNRSIVAAPFMMRTSCTNSTIWMDEAWQVKHLITREYERSDAAFIFNSLKYNLGKMMKLGDQMLENIVAADADEIDDFASVVQKLSKAHGLSEEENSYFLIGTEGEHTRMAVVNGLTMMSQHVPDPVRAVNFEGLAGRILANPDSLFGKAATRQASWMDG